MLKVSGMRNAEIELGKEEREKWEKVSEQQICIMLNKWALKCRKVKDELQSLKESDEHEFVSSN